MYVSTCLFLLFLSTEIQAAEAMKWLREAGFPQYAQMYEGEFQSRTEKTKDQKIFFFLSYQLQLTSLLEFYSSFEQKKIHDTRFCMLRLSSVIQISSFLHFKEAIIIVKQNIYVQSKFVCMNIEQHRTNTKAQVDRGIGYDEANDFFSRESFCLWLFCSEK